MQDLTNLTDLCEKVEKIDFSTFPSKSVESCMNGWTDLQVDLSELVAAHLFYMNLNFHGHSFIIQCDISILLKSIKICKSQVVATLCGGLHPKSRKRGMEQGLCSRKGDMHISAFLASLHTLFSILIYYRWCLSEKPQYLSAKKEHCLLQLTTFLTCWCLAISVVSLDKATKAKTLIQVSVSLSSFARLCSHTI